MGFTVGAMSERAALAYGRATVEHLIDFEAYLNGPHRFGAVDGAVLNILRLRIQILAEHIDGLERGGSVRTGVIEALSAVSTACCDMLLEHGPLTMVATGTTAHRRT